MPTSNRAFWERKIAANRERDRRKVSLLEQAGWRVLVLWECELPAAFLDKAVAFLGRPEPGAATTWSARTTPVDGALPAAATRPLAATP